MIHVVKEHIADLFNGSQGYESFRKVLRETAEFGYDVSEALTPKSPSQEPTANLGPAARRFYCSNCNSYFSSSEFSNKKSTMVCISCGYRRSYLVAS